MKKLSEAHPLIRFAVSANNFLQILAIPLGLIYGLMVLGLPMPYNILALVLGISLMILCSALSNSVFIQYDYGKKKEDARLKEALNQTGRELPESAPSFSFLFLRNSLSAIAVALILAFFVLASFKLAPWIASFLSDAPPDSRAAVSMRMFIGLSVILFGLFFVPRAAVTIPKYLDLFVFKHEGMRLAYYKAEDEKPPQLWGWIKGFFSILLPVLAIVALTFFRAYINQIDSSSFPDWVLYLMTAGIASLPFLGLWFVLSRRSKTQEALSPEKETEIAEKFGAASPEMAEFKDSQRLLNSIGAQTANKTMRYFLIGGGICLMLLYLVQFAMAFLPRFITIPLAVITLFGMMIGALYFVAKLGRLKADLPEDFVLLVDTLKRADYDAAKIAAEKVLNNFPPIEANMPAASVYAALGDLARAEALIRDAIKVILELDEGNYKKAILAKHLGLLGKILILDKRYQEAEEFLYQGQRLEQQEAPIHTFLAELLLIQNLSPNIALDYLTKAFEVNEQMEMLDKSRHSQMLTARILKAWALSRMGDVEAADALLNEAFGLSDKTIIPEQSELHYYAGHLALAQGRQDSAKTAFQHSIDIDPNGLYARLSQKML